MTRSVTAWLCCSALFLTACATSSVDEHGHSPEDDLGLRWVKSAAEYRAITRQVYAAASDDLADFIADPDWSALPWQTDAGASRSI